MRKKILVKSLALLLCATTLLSSVPVHASEIDTDTTTQVATEETTTEAVATQDTEATTEVVKENVTENVTEENTTQETTTDVEITKMNESDYVPTDLFAMDVLTASVEELNQAYLTHGYMEVAAWISTLSDEEIKALGKQDTYFTQPFQISVDVCREDGIVAGNYSRALDFLVKVAKCTHVNVADFNSNYEYFMIKVPWSATGAKVQVGKSGLSGKNPSTQQTNLTWTLTGNAGISIDGHCSELFINGEGTDTKNYTQFWGRFKVVKPFGYAKNGYSVIKGNATTNFKLCADYKKDGKRIYSKGAFTNKETNVPTAETYTFTVIGNLNNLGGTASAPATSITLNYKEVTYNVSLDGTISTYKYLAPGKLPAGQNKSVNVTFNNGNETGSSVVPVTIPWASWSGYAAGTSTNTVAGRTLTSAYRNGSIALPATPIANTYTLNVDPQGGTGNITGVQGTQTFLGWQVNGTNKTTGPATISAATTITGQWTNPTITVPTAPTKTGYTFAGWTINGKPYQAGDQITLAANATATAQWTAHSYNVAYNLNGGTSDTEIEGATVEYGKEFKITGIVPLKEDYAETNSAYTFIGWATNAGATSPNYTQSQSVKNLTDTNGATVTLYAVYKENTTRIDPNNRDTPVIDTTEITNEINKLKDKIDKLTNVTDLTKTDTDSIKKMIQSLFGVDSNIASTLTDFITSCNLSNEKKITILKHLSDGYLTAQDKADLMNAINGSSFSDSMKQSLLDAINGFTSLTFDQQKQILAALNSGSSANYTTGNGVTYTITKNADGTITVALKSLDGVTNLVIPNSITVAGTTFPITAVAPNAFKGNTTIKTVTIPSNVSTIGASAFEGCTKLTTVNTTKGLVTIGSKAFKNCKSLTKFTCPSTLKTIGDSAFESCIKLKTITFNTGLLTIGNKAFYNCKALTKISIPKTVIKIGKYAFAKCIKVTSVKFSSFSESQLLSMGTGVFAYDKKLKSIKLPSKLRAIASKAFYKDTALTKVTGMKRISTIGTSAFEGCKKISSITLQDRTQIISKKAFYGCSRLKKVTIKSKGLTKVSSKAFKKCKKNITFKVPNSKINDYNKLLKGKY